MEYKEFVEKYAIQVDKKQEKAVKSKNGPVLVLSVPGSGKTTTIVAHIGYLVFVENIDPRKILVLAYNKSAQLDLKSRVAKKYGSQLAFTVTIRTVHGFCYQVISEVLGKVEMIEEWERRKIIRSKYTEITEEYPLDQELKGIEAFIEYVKSSMMSPAKIAEYVQKSNTNLELEYQCYLYYQEQIHLLGKRDFNDLEIITCNLLNKRKDVLEFFQRRYEYICVDEAQDISLIQHKIIDLLARKGSNNLFMVGDEDQSIYRFRAAYPEALLAFENRWENASKVIMNTNYRSTSSIVQGANRLIKHNSSHQNKKMKATSEEDEVIQFKLIKSRLVQYEWLVDYIITESTADPEASIAVLYRDNDSSIPLIDLLDRKQVQFTLNRRVNAGEENTNVFSSRLIVDLEKVVRLSKCLYSIEGNQLFSELCYKLDIHIPKDKINNTRKYVEKCLNKGQKISIIDVFIDQKGMSQRNIVILNKLKNYLSQLDHLEAKKAIQILFTELELSLKSMDEEDWKLKRDILYALSTQVQSMDELIERIHELSKVMVSATQEKSNIILTTIHSAKGLEFDQVIVMDMVDPLFPKYNVNDSQTEIQEAIQEERNLAYVAITRAKKKLTLLEYSGKTSTFIREIRGYEVKRKRKSKK